MIYPYPEDLTWVGHVPKIHNEGERAMKTLFGLLIFLAVLYCGIGVAMALYEKSQTDNPIKWRTVYMWLPMLLGKA